MSIAAENLTGGATPLVAADDMRAALPSIDMLGLAVHRVTMDDAVEHIVDCVDRRLGGWVLTPNVDILRRWVRSEDFRKATSAVTLCVADGMPLMWASRMAGCPLPQRITGADLSRKLIEAVAQREVSVFLLGGAPGAAEAAIAQMRAAHPQLDVAGMHFPPYGFEQDPAEWDAMRAALTAAQADIVFVGLGSPKQENVIRRLRHVLPHAWWLGVGVTFSFLGGTISRAPVWMQQSGLEWLHRLTCEPRRLAKRYLIDDLPFALWLLARAAGGKLKDSAGDSNYSPARASCALLTTPTSEDAT